MRDKEGRERKDTLSLVPDRLSFVIDFALSLPSRFRGKEVPVFASFHALALLGPFSRRSYWPVRMERMPLVVSTM